MANVFRKYQKRIVSVFLVGLMSILMVAFLLPEGWHGQTGDRIPAGQVHGQRVFQDQIFQATREWDLLRSVYRQPLGTDQRLSVLYRLGDDRVLAEIDRHPEMFFLLQREAQQMGVRVSQDELESEMQIVGVHGRELGRDPVLRDNVRRALHNLLLIEGAFQRTASIVKISQPHREMDMAIQGQMIRVNLVDFRSGDFLDSVGHPTDEQLLAHFDRYADTVAGEPHPQDNPFGFGYRYPDRVAFQYIHLPRDLARRAVLAGRSDYDWQVAIQRYYHSNRQMFETTQPPPLPAAPFEFGIVPRLALNPQTGPRIRQSWEVEEQILDRLVEPQVDRLMFSLQQQINTALQEDFTAWQEDPGHPSSVDAPYASYEYLQRLSGMIERRNQVRPIIASHPDLKSPQDVLRMLEIGDAVFRDIPFAHYAIEYARPIARETGSHRHDDELIDLWQPSPVFQDDGDVFIFRLTDARPSRRPDSIDEVYQRVLRDWQTAQSYDLALANAQALIDATQDQRLSSAAEQIGRSVITTSPFAAFPFGYLPEYPLTGTAYASFVDQSFRLLQDAGRTGDEHPTRLVTLPEAARLLVVELEEVASRWTEQQLRQAEREVNLDAQRRLAELMRRQWFDFQTLIARTGWREHDAHPIAPEPDPIARSPVGR